MKEAFRKERARFAKDRERLEKEIQDEEEAQDAARQGLRDAFYGAQRGEAAGDVPMLEGPDADQVFEAWAQEDEGAANAMLRRALAPAMTTPTRPTVAAPRSPPAGIPGNALGAMSAGPSVAVNDPKHHDVSSLDPYCHPASSSATYEWANPGCPTRPYTGQREHGAAGPCHERGTSSCPRQWRTCLGWHSLRRGIWQESHPAGSGVKASCYGTFWGHSRSASRCRNRTRPTAASWFSNLEDDDELDHVGDSDLG